ncbi:helix-turn-helix transcriptional regulator [Halomonas venusta]|uniref:response regulator transcription factor n=1 Tax=Vreelandella venusta TaxID=44935 RepID=UPI00295F57B2|nr:helix-turn-helix transcriptional regulator [Halomonas venusta]MDW0360854.1 helix-turn-helix transcriptional regulator [Halomonas venusta]
MEISFGDWAATVDPMRGAGLTEMEANYLIRVANGMTHKEVARELGRSQETVKKGLQRAYQRLGAASAITAITKAQAKGWIRYAGKVAMCALLSVAMLTGTDDAMRRSGKTRIARRAAVVQMIA